MLPTLSRAWRDTLQHRLHCAVAAQRPWGTRAWLWLGADPNAFVPVPYQWGWDPTTDLQHPIEKGWTFVHLAASRGCPRVIDRLADGGGRMNEPAGALGATPLMVAAWHGSFDAMDALVRRGADAGTWTTRPEEAEGLMRTRESGVAERWRAWRANREAGDLETALPMATARRAPRL